jgi:BirA family biotin operon repressor/biotin-[acetyl-CoA-carboxylase] ligase
MIRSHCQSIDSTSAEARRVALRFPGKGVLVSAAVQTAGRGRHGRLWTSPKGGAWFTLGHPYEGHPESVRPVPLLAGLAVVEYLESALGAAGGAEFSLKWPNDVLLDGRKVAGVLCEQVLAQNDNEGLLLIGIGINLNLRPEQLPRTTRFPATSVLATTGVTLDITAAIDGCVHGLTSQLHKLDAGILTVEQTLAIEQRLAWRQQPVQMEKGSNTVRGTLTGIDRYGRLRLLGDGVERVWDGGEIQEGWSRQRGLYG